MRIERLALERYGLFSDRELAFAPDASLHVVLGPNEAGKTSALSAIGDLLFGFPTRTDYDFLHDSKALRIGGSLRHSNGKTITVRRRKGNKNTLLDADDQSLPDDFLDFLLIGTSREMFGREFGLTAAALRAGGEELLSAGGRLAETLAASSAGMAGLSSVQEQLQKSADELFTSSRRSSGKPFYSASDRRDRADKELREATVTPDALKQVRIAEEGADARLEELKVAHATSGSLVGRWQRTLRVRSQLVRLDRIGDELATLAELPDVAQQSVANWRATLDERDVLEREIGALDAAAQSDAIELDALAVDDALLSNATTIESLRERLGAVRKAIEDLPRRKQARDSAEAQLNDAARKLGLISHVELLQKSPTDFALVDARALTDKIGRVGQRLIEIEARYARAEQESRTYEGEDANEELVRDIEPLKQRFNALGDVQAMQSQLRRDQAALAVELKGISEAAMALDPSPGSAARLRTLQVPEPFAIAEFVKAVEVAEAEAGRLRGAVSIHDKAIADTESEVVLLTSSGRVPTRIDLMDVRAARDEQLERLRAELDGDRSSRAERIEDVARTSQKIDGITDGLLSDTQRATRLEDAQRRIAGVRKEREADADRLARLEVDLGRVIQEWRDAWVASSLAPRSPAEMQRWRTRFDELISRSAKCDARQADIDAIAAGLGAAKVAVITFLESTGRRTDPKLPADILFQEARGRFDELVAAWGDARAHAAAKDKLQRDLAEASDQRGQLVQELASLRETWPAVMAAIGLPGSATPVHAEAALSVWSSVGVPKASHEREARSVETISSDLQEFDRDVSELTARVSADLTSLPSQAALLQVAQRLGEARQANEARERLRAAATKRTAVRGASLAKLETNETALEGACKLLRSADLTELVRNIERLQQRHVLERERAELRRLLIDISDGYDEATLRSEREGIDFDRLPADIERESLNQKQLLDEIREASVVHDQKRREVEELTKGRDAAGAAARRTEVGAELISIAEQWLLRSAAALLARRAVELHRSKVQDPMIARASMLFALATDQAFSGLGIDYDDADQPVLVGRRNADGHVHISGMSEGTRDQLFLSLRLALLERRVSEPMPFIGDDLLTSFDDARTRAGLKLLVAAGRDRQVILFTHHGFVAELAASLGDPAVQVIQL